MLLVYGTVKRWVEQVASSGPGEGWRAIDSECKVYGGGADGPTVAAGGR